MNWGLCKQGDLVCWITNNSLSNSNPMSIIFTYWVVLKNAFINSHFVLFLAIEMNTDDDINIRWRKELALSNSQWYFSADVLAACKCRKEMAWYWYSFPLFAWERLMEIKAVNGWIFNLCLIVCIEYIILMIMIPTEWRLTYDIYTVSASDFRVYCGVLTWSSCLISL